MKLYLVLGCWGRGDEFKFCGGVSNRILDLTLHSAVNTSITNTLDTTFKLFDRPLYNNVHTAIWSIQDKYSEAGKPVFHNFKQLEEFCILHSKCGVFLKLELK